MSPDLSEASRLVSCGMHLVPLVRHTKQPSGMRWQRASRVTEIDPQATGYGLPLAKNDLCSIDPDHWPLAVKGMAALGFDLDELMAAGVRTASTRPDSGGRSTFLAPEGVRWLTFAYRDSAGQGVTVLELRADSPNLQDCVPGVVYADKQGELQTQSYANGRRLDEAPALPSSLAHWWRRCSTDLQFRREQQTLFCRALGVEPVKSISTGSPGEPLAFPAPGIRGHYNADNRVEDILARHGYLYDSYTKRYAPPSASGAPGVRAIPDKDGLWHSDHASDPLHGTFDAWIAHVVLDHGGDVDAAIAARRPTPKPTVRPGWESGLDLLTPMEPQPELVAGWVPERGLGILYGASQAYKTFTAVNLACSVANGVDWHDHAVKRGTVGYITGESRHGVKSRIQGWCRKHGLTPEGLHLRNSAINIMDPGAVDEIRETFPDGLALLVVDTYRRNIGPSNGKPVSENSADDFGQACNLLQPLIEQLGCSIIIIHHENKSGALSGTGAFFTNADFVIRQTGNGGSAAGDWAAEVICEKLKEAELPSPLTLKGERVTLESGGTTLVFSAGEPSSSFDDVRLTRMNAALKTDDAVEVDGKRWLTKQALASLWAVDVRHAERTLAALIQRGRVEKRAPDRPNDRALYRPR
jgi:hypothetical protein